jgi:DEAD/DEAH box helicase domain-containing protein
MPDVQNVLGQLADEASGRGVDVTVLPVEGRSASYAELERSLPPSLQEALLRKGITQLYSHQVAAIDALRDGTNVVLATGTASGKSLAYQLPIAESMVGSAPATALCLFPTKALAADQLQSFRSLLLPELAVYSYDGDTHPDERSWVRQNANVLLSNPDMCHRSILPAHRRWATFLMRLQWIVVDELHSLRGVFGSHVGHVLRRVLRLCEHYGATPTICFTSATIGNPKELAEAVAGVSVEVIDTDGSPKPASSLALWRRPIPVDGRPIASADIEVARLLGRFAAEGHRSLAFAGSRRNAESIAAQAQAMFQDHKSQIAAYRGGFLPQERRELEDRFRDGSLKALAATNALELGIDIPGLDAVVLNGFPGTIASMRQQIGRAGRRDCPSVAIVVNGDDQLDSWYFDHPDQFISRSPEPAVVNPSNPRMLRAHVACAAAELPLTPGDRDRFGDGMDEIVTDLVRDDLLLVRDGGLIWAPTWSPAAEVDLRSGGGGEVRLRCVDGSEPLLVGTIDSTRAPSGVHPGAVYVHQGHHYKVTSLDLENRSAELVTTDGSEYTQARLTSEISVVNTDAVKRHGAFTQAVGTVDVESCVTGYQVRDRATRVVLDTVDLDLPPQRLVTRASWLMVDNSVMDLLDFGNEQVLSAMHAIEHAMIGMLPLFAICDRWDVGGLSMADHPETGSPTLFIYDGYPGGAGIADLAFSRGVKHVQATYDLISNCGCSSGCPGCIQSPKCGNWNEFLDKQAALAVLGQIIQSEDC